MTLELAIRILKGPRNEQLYQKLKEIYTTYSPQEIADGIGYIRSEFILEELDLTLESAEAQLLADKNRIKSTSKTVK